MNESHSTDDFGYHKENVLIDKNHVDKYEITVGAILTQNTSWKNVMICIDKLKKCRIDTGEKFLNENEIIIKSCIRSAGYYNQKYKKLKLTIKHFYDNGFFENGVPERGELLELWGIGDETADSILLYAFDRNSFVIDTYTKRLLYRLGLKNENCRYIELKKYFEENIPEKTEVYNEFHALIVRHSVEICRKKPLCNSCPLKRWCSF